VKRRRHRAEHRDVRKGVRAVVWSISRRGREDVTMVVELERS
jgi:hypothetical protein